MWLGESERIVRDLFAQARARRKEGTLPFIFIDEAESILGTRRSMRSFTINSTWFRCSARKWTGSSRSRMS